MAGFRSDLSRAQGLGSAKHGVGAWLVERVTSVALVPLVIWAVYSGLVLAAARYDGAVAWLRSPLNAVLTVLLIAVGFWHMHAGMRVVVEDYIHKTMSKAVILLLNLGVCVLGAALAIFCVLKVALSAGVV